MIFKNLELKEYFSLLGEDDRNPSVDIYLPYDSLNRKDYKRPCLVICPGGGYGFCSLREAEPIALKFLPEGFNVFVLWYSVAPHKFPTQIREVAALMELIHNNAQEWNCDTEKISIMGFSAGAHLAGHYSTMFDCTEVRKLFPESKPVNASVLCYPVISAKEGKCHKGSFEKLVGHYPLTEAEMKKFSLEYCVTDKTPPAFLWHTATDTCVPVYSSLAYANALSEHNVSFELRIFPEGQHGVATCDSQTLDDYKRFYDYDKVWIKETVDWLRYMNLA
jgi:acetyl esterase/lipase